MTLTDTIPRVLRSELTLRGWTLTDLGQKFDPPVNCDQAAKRIKSAGRDLRLLLLVCDAIGLDPIDVLIAANGLATEAKGGRTDDA